MARGGYRELLRNRPLALLWTGDALSTIGDDFFNVAVM